MMNEAVRARTVPGLLRARVAQSPEAVAFAYEEAGTWREISWQTFGERVEKLARGLHRRGLALGDHVGILAATGLEWEICHHAILLAGGVVVGLEPHDTAERIRWIARHAAIRFLVVGDELLLRKLDPQELRGYALVVQLADVGEEAPGANIVSLGEVEATVPGSNCLPEPQPGAAATLIYTSGTTGQPKGILYRHEQVVLAVRSILQAYPPLPVGSRFVCWLPLSNLFQRIMNITGMCSGGTAYLVKDPLRVLQALPHARPDVFIGVPRFYEKLKAGMAREISARPGWIRSLIGWSIATGEQYASRMRTGGKVGAWLTFAHKLAEMSVLSKLRKVMGGRLRFAVTGSAPTPESLLRFFDAIGLPVYEAYGMSECIVPVALNTPTHRRLGTVGRPLPVNRIRLADDGELLIQGEGVFSGYYNDSDRAGSFTADGYYHTGDYAELETGGFLRLKGRKSEIIKTSSGRRVSPVGIETVLQELPYVDRAVVVGAGRKCLAAILTLDREAIERSQHGALRGVPNEAMAAELAAIVERLPEHERPAGYLVLDGPFTLERGEITPNLKLRRKVIEERYQTQIESLFERIERDQGRGLVLLKG